MEEIEDLDFTPLRDMTSEERFALFPNLNTEKYSIKSPPLKIYNCVAWASGINYKRIDFYRDKLTGEINEDQSAEPYMQHFRTLGYLECESPNYERGYEKIALYEDRRGNFTHVARQLDNNTWTSKLGYLEDIEHTSLESLEGRGKDRYGNHIFYMKRIKN